MALIQVKEIVGARVQFSLAISDHFDFFSNLRVTLVIATELIYLL